MTRLAQTKRRASYFVGSMGANAQCVEHPYHQQGRSGASFPFGGIARFGSRSEHKLIKAGAVGWSQANMPDRLGQVRWSRGESARVRVC